MAQVSWQYNTTIADCNRCISDLERYGLQIKHIKIFMPLLGHFIASCPLQPKDLAHSTSRNSGGRNLFLPAFDMGGPMGTQLAFLVPSG